MDLLIDTHAVIWFITDNETPKSPGSCLHETEHFNQSKFMLPFLSH